MCIQIKFSGARRLYEEIEISGVIGYNGYSGRALQRVINFQFLKHYQVFWIFNKIFYGTGSLLHILEHWKDIFVMFDSVDCLQRII